ncbi:MAG: DNA-binding protein, partial [Clostridia bacterium]
MQYKRFNNKIVLRLEIGEDIIEKVLELAKLEHIKLASVTGIGACDYVKIGAFKVAEKKYYANEYNEEMEMTSLVGNLTTKDGVEYLHLHANFAGVNGNAVGGHLNCARVSATAEIFVDIVDGVVEREVNSV